MAAWPIPRGLIATMQFESSKAPDRRAYPDGKTVLLRFVTYYTSCTGRSQVHRNRHRQLCTRSTYLTSRRREPRTQAVARYRGWLERCTLELTRSLLNHTLGMLAQALSPLEVVAMTHLDLDLVSDNEASCET